MPVVTCSITDQSLDPSPSHAADPRHGALAAFLGIVRNHDHGEAVEALEYSSHPEAERILRAVCEDVTAEADVAVGVQHRIGHLRIGDLALVVTVSSAHRHDAFEICRQLVERIKKEVPIWKRQHLASGATEWVGL